MDCPSKPPRRQAVLIAVHPDGFLEAFGAKSVDVRFVRLPVANGRVNEILAEQCFELMLPPRYRELWRRDLLRASGTSQPLTPETALAALKTKDCLAALNKASEPMERVA
jgi:hypothetical protein